MSGAIGYDEDWNRDVGYGVPAICDHPGCNKEIDRGLSYVCGGEPYGGQLGCGLYFCEQHLESAEYVTGTESTTFTAMVCQRCADCDEPFTPKPDVPKWNQWKLTDQSWQRWRDENPEAVATLRASLS